MLLEVCAFSLLPCDLLLIGLFSQHLECFQEGPLEQLFSPWTAESQRDGSQGCSCNSSSENSEVQMISPHQSLRNLGWVPALCCKKPSRDFLSFFFFKIWNASRISFAFMLRLLLLTYHEKGRVCKLDFFFLERHFHQVLKKKKSDPVTC